MGYPRPGLKKQKVNKQKLENRVAGVPSLSVPAVSPRDGSRIAMGGAWSSRSAPEHLKNGPASRVPTQPGHAGLHGPWLPPGVPARLPGAFQEAAGESEHPLAAPLHGGPSAVVRGAGSDTGIRGDTREHPQPR